MCNPSQELWTSCCGCVGSAWISADLEGYKQLTVRGFEALVVEALRTLKAENDHIKVQNQALETRGVGLEAKLQASVLTNDLHNNGATR
jgi:hypothetical protein